MKSRTLLMVVCILTLANVARPDNIRGINMDFVNIGNAGNAADTGGFVGCGAVAYNYCISQYEITNAQWNVFTSAAGRPTGTPSTPYDLNAQFTGAKQPTNNISWYEAVQFCNYLTSGDKSKGVYLFSGNNTNPGTFIGVNRESAMSVYGIIYCLPTEDEWYKAAYYKPNGSGYSLYANGQNSMPDADNGWNYYGGAYSGLWNVGTGLMEQNGTWDMMGNVWEWNERLIGSNRGIRGGSSKSQLSDVSMASPPRGNGYDPSNEANLVGFRIVSVPEPCTLALLGLGGLFLGRRSK